MRHSRLPRAIAPREAYVLERARGQRVLHLGCADAPFTAERLASETLLHLRLLKVSKSCLGLELDSAAARILEGALGAGVVHVGDAEHLERLAPRQFDLVVAGEIIEHLNNPGLLLASAREVLAAGGELLITTTNAFCLRRLLRIPFGVESIHADHTAYYSHTTLRTLVTRFGYSLVEALGYRLQRPCPILPLLADAAAASLSPNLAEGIIHRYRLDNGTTPLEAAAAPPSGPS